MFTDFSTQSHTQTQIYIDTWMNRQMDSPNTKCLWWLIAGKGITMAMCISE